MHRDVLEFKVWEKGSLLDQSKDVPNNAIKTQSVFSFYENGMSFAYIGRNMPKKLGKVII